MSATSDDARATCTPCRGTGKLVSGLGGQPHEVTCPWCGGTGEFQPGRDAQQGAPAEAGAQPASHRT
jgi:DnaJ-class molecular chaperone